jgi:taurine---2-oxoglutarate transaminase
VTEKKLKEETMVSTARPEINAQQVANDAREYLLSPWSVQSTVKPLVIAGGEGSWLIEAGGRRILDFSSQLVNTNIGHQHPKVVAAIKEQAEKMCFVTSPFVNDATTELAKMLAEIMPGTLSKTMFTTGGTEAVDTAIKIARLATGRQKIISRYRSFHGGTFGGMSIGGDMRRWANEPGIPGTVKILDPYCYRCSFGQAGSESCQMECLKHVEEIIWYEGPQYIAAIFTEGIVGSNGIIVPPDGYMQGLRRLCDKYGILLVVDEVMSGFGRTGEWFAANNWNIEPDIMTFAKGVNSGYVPLGGVAVNERVANYFEDHMFWGGLTYSGHALACAAGIATINVYKEENLIQRSKEMGKKLLAKLEVLKDKHPSVGDVRGMGLFCAIELVKDKSSREMLVQWNGPDQSLTGKIKAALIQRNVYAFGRWNTFFIAPPLIVTEEELDFGVKAFDEALTIADEAAAK